MTDFFIEKAYADILAGVTNAITEDFRGDALEQFRDAMIKYGAIQLRMGCVTKHQLMPVLAKIIKGLVVDEENLFKIWGLIGGEVTYLARGFRTPRHQMILALATGFVIKCEETAKASEVALINRMMFSY